jgi:signal transduction histidine kinase
MNLLAAGDFKTRLSYGKPLGNHPTLREITDSFNRMAEELEHTEMLRSDFINNFSHEFKTPIVSITGFTKLLKRGNLTEDEKEEYLDIIEEESLRLSAMATNVLNMTKVENQTILTNVSRFNLSEQIRSCVLLLEKRWTDKHIEFSLEFEEEEISANEELLKQVWLNLIDNAIKYSPEYGFIVIKIRKEEDNWYRVSVGNTGIEIPKEKQQKIFQKFYQVDESHSSEGNGIGLAIVQYITRLHGGEVSVECANGMTTFTVKMPQAHSF